MTNCPTCGRSVAENQRFCGNCGTDVQAAIAYRANVPNAPTAPRDEIPTPVSTSAPDANTSPYVNTNLYANDARAYDLPAPVRRMPVASWVVIAGVALFCLCCGLVLGTIFGIELPDIFPGIMPPPTVPTPAATPQTMIFVLQFLRT